MNNKHIDKLKAYGINPADYDEFEMEEIADTLHTYEENKAYADSYRKELEVGARGVPLADLSAKTLRTLDTLCRMEGFSASLRLCVYL